MLPYYHKTSAASMLVYMDAALNMIKDDSVLQVVPVGAIVLIIPEVILTGTGRAIATATIAEDGLSSALALNVSQGIGAIKNLG